MNLKKFIITLETVTVDGGKMSADDFGVLFEQKKFLILILLAAVAGTFKNAPVLHRWNHSVWQKLSLWTFT